MSSPLAPGPLPSRPANRITRKRPITSCSECNRRKQKAAHFLYTSSNGTDDKQCNKAWPCNHCLGRKSPHLCRFGVGKSSGKAKHDVKRSIDNSTLPRSDIPEHEDKKSEDILEDILSSDTVLGKILHATAESLTSDAASRPDPRRSDKELLKYFPTRRVVDFLIQHFLTEVNWLYEEISTQSFLERYSTWWSQPHYQGDGDVQFGVLILRLCVNALQFLPHPNVSTEGELGDKMLLNELESKCNMAACKLDGYRPRKASIVRVEQLLIYIATLLNSANAKESYHILGEAIKEAREIDLFLEEKWVDFTEFERNERRKAFWYLHVWDRFHCTFLGRWPLIPEHYHSVQLPSETPYSLTTIANTPTQFTDVILHIKLHRFMASFISAPAQESERSNPYIIDAHIKTFRLQLIDTLPPAFRLENPDTSWDIAIPTLPMKRAAAHIVIYGVIEGMHKCFVGPLTPQSVTSYISRWKDDEDGAKLVLLHRKTLANACLNALTLTTDLHKLMGGGPHRYFLLSIATIEASAMLGMVILSDLLMKSTNLISQPNISPVFEPALQDTCHEAFQEALNLLQVLAQRSVLAQKGVRIWEELNRRILRLQELQSRKDHQDGETGECRSNDGLHRDSINSSNGGVALVEGQNNIGANVCDAAGLQTAAGDVRCNFRNARSGQPSDGDFMAVEWESIATGTDFSWFFENFDNLENEGLGGLEMDHFWGGFT